MSRMLMAEMASILCLNPARFKYSYGSDAASADHYLHIVRAGHFGIVAVVPRVLHDNGALAGQSVALGEAKQLGTKSIMTMSTTAFASYVLPENIGPTMRWMDPRLWH